MTSATCRQPWARLALPMLLLGAAACGGGGGGSPDIRREPGGQNQPPVAQFSASISDGLAPLNVTFDAGASSDPDGTITTYQWDFGDDGSAAGATTSHTFTDTGVFTVTLQITDDDGGTDSTTAAVRVRGATVSGVIQIAPGSSVDSDVNDRLTVPVSNNSFGEAQPIGDPATLGSPLRLGGFVNMPGSGPPDGNFSASGDPEDIFAVDLTGDERIVLSIGDPSADLDLELYDDAPTPELIDASVSPDPQNDPTEDLPAPDEPGRYFVRVVASSGGSNYVLSIEEDTGATAVKRRAKRVSDPFVPGEVLMAETRQARLRRYGITPATGGRGARLQALDRAGPTAPDLRLATLELPDGATISAARAARYRTLMAARDLTTRAGAHLAEVNVLRRPMLAPDDTFYDRQWHYRNINLEAAWNLTTGDASPDVVVAVVDTGVLLDHEDLENKLLRDGAGQVIGFDFIQDPARANDGDGIDPNPDDPGDSAEGPEQSSFHGTHVAGTVGAESNNGIGVAGVSWGARLMPLRALGIDGGTTFDVMQAVRYAAGLSNASGTVPPVRADIINLSLGSDFYSEAEQQTLNEVRAQGIFLVASAGNESSSVPSYPASYDGVISVSASTIIDGLAGYSSFGPVIDVAAPGGEAVDRNGDGDPDAVASTRGPGTQSYAFLIGTSMSAPHVSGVMALMKAVHPGLTPAEFDGLLQSGRLTRDVGPPGRDDSFGWGIIEADLAVVAAQDLSGDMIGPVISSSVSTLNFQAFTQQLDFAVTNVGDEPVTVTVTGSSNAPWLTVTRTDGDADGFGRYRVTVDRDGLADGPYGADITIAPQNAPGVMPVTVNVLMQVTSPDLNADAGQHYVVLVNPAEDESVAVQVVNASNGRYEFTLDDVPPGSYRLFAGTDLDNDEFICDGGEACGAYPSLSSPEIIEVDAAAEPVIDDVSFASEFRTTATTNAAAGDADGAKDGQALPLVKPARP